MPTEQLSEREVQALEHIRKAEEFEVTLAEYARSFDLDVKELYNAKQALVRKGVIVGRVNGDESEAIQPSGFVPVQVVAPSSSSGAQLAAFVIRADF